MLRFLQAKTKELSQKKSKNCTVILYVSCFNVVQCRAIKKYSIIVASAETTNSREN